MLAERGYLLTQDDMNMTMDDFKATFGDNPPSVDTHGHERSDAMRDVLRCCCPSAFLPIPTRLGRLAGGVRPSTSSDVIAHATSERERIYVWKISTPIGLAAATVVQNAQSTCVWSCCCCRCLLFVSRDKLTVLASKKDNPAEQIFVFWADEEKLGVAPVKK